MPYSAVNLTTKIEDEQTPAERDATQQVPISHAQSEGAMESQETDNVVNLTNHKDDPNRAYKKRPRNPQAAGDDQPWTVSFDPILSTDKCYKNSEYAHIVDYLSRHPLDIADLKEKSHDEAVDELNHKLYQLKCVSYDVRHRLIQCKSKSKSMMS